MLAAALPDTRVDLIESVGRKCDFIARAIDAAGLGNAAVVRGRSEDWAASPRPPADARLTTRSPRGRSAAWRRSLSWPRRCSPTAGTLVAWKGRRDPDEEAELERASERLAMVPEEIRWVGPYAGSENRHLHLIRKQGPTPEGLPRRPGVAKKRPMGPGG